MNSDTLFHGLKELLGACAAMQQPADAGTGPHNIHCCWFLPRSYTAPPLYRQANLLETTRLDWMYASFPAANYSSMYGSCFTYCGLALNQLYTCPLFFSFRA